MFLSIFFVTSFGASAPGIKTPPTNKSHSEINFSKSVSSLNFGIIRSPNFFDNSFSLCSDLSTI